MPSVQLSRSSFARTLVRFLCFATLATQLACQEPDELMPRLMLGDDGNAGLADDAGTTGAQPSDGGPALECARPGCACADETPPRSCVPPDFYLADGTKACAVGAMYCRDGFWTDCESLSAL